MASQLDEILGLLASGAYTLDQACQAVSTAVRTNPNGTRMWNMLLESRITQQQISAAVGRALLDALVTFEPDKTMWLGPPTRTESISKPASIQSAPQIHSAEQLRAFLWDNKAGIANAANAPSVAPPIAPVDWIDSVEPIKTAAPPRPLPSAPPPLPGPELGSIIKNRYRLDAHLGFGGIGQVFSATDLQAPQPLTVTIKMIAVDLKREPQALSALQAAVAQTKTLRHPNIVTTYGIESDESRVFIVMEALTGRWLGEQVRAVRNVGVEPRAAWQIVEGIANGLAHAHRHGIVHSDLSPYTIFVADDGVPKIMGFGLIHAVPTSNEAMDLLDTMTLRAYSEAYTADAWATHATPHPADDLYPLGVIAYELFTGKHPFGRHSLTSARQKHLAYEPVSGIDRRAAKLIAKCLSFERKERPKNATRFLRRMHGPALLHWLMGDRMAVANKD